MKKARPVLKKATKAVTAKRAPRRPFPYLRVAKLWEKKKTIAQIAKAVDRVGKGKDPYHAFRVLLTRMHKGYKNREGKLVKLPYRVGKSTLKLAARAGKKASAQIR